MLVVMETPAQPVRQAIRALVVLLVLLDTITMLEPASFALASAHFVISVLLIHRAFFVHLAILAQHVAHALLDSSITQTFVVLVRQLAHDANPVVMQLDAWFVALDTLELRV